MKPIPRLLLILCIAAITCQALYFGFVRGYSNFNCHVLGTYTEIFQGTAPHDILFIGSSRTKTTTEPRIIDSICHLDTYNCGVSGGNMVEFKTTLEGYLQNHPAPGKVVLNIDLQSFIGKQRFNNQMLFYPFIKNKVVDEALNENGHPTALLKVLPFMIFPELDDYTRGNVVRGIMGEKGKDVFVPASYYKGFMEFNNKLTDIAPEDTVRIMLEVSDKYVAYLRDMVKTCKEKKIKLIFTYAPEYEHLSQTHHIGNAKGIFAIIYDIAGENNIPVWRFDSLDICHDRKLFADAYHLNGEGARIYSAILARKLCDMKEE